MSIKVEYKNSLGALVTEQQKNNLSEYFELKYDSNTNKLKTKIHYLGDNIINEGSYFMDSSENINEVIAKIDHSHRWGIFNDLQVVNGYNVWRENYYQDEELSELYSKVVLKANGDLIAGMGFDISNQPTRGCVKRFDLSNKNMVIDGEIEGVFEQGDYVTFGHSSDGSFKAWTNTELFIKPYESLDRFIEEAEGSYILNLMNQEMRDYFLNFQPLVPTFQL